MIAEAAANRLLSALKPTDRAELIERGRLLALRQYEIILDREQPLEAVLFPMSGVISLIATFKNGTSLEMATIGREGCLGLGAILTSAPAIAHCMVQADGQALAVPRQHVMAALDHSPVLKGLFNNYGEAVLVQALVSGGCNVAHTVSQRLARWLLMMQDRMDTNQVPLTQELLSAMLGVRRPTVTLAAQQLQEAGCIRYKRGSVTIRDREELERWSCECYGVIRDAYTKLLPHTYGGS